MTSYSLKNLKVTTEADLFCITSAVIYIDGWTLYSCREIHNIKSSSCMFFLYNFMTIRELSSKIERAIVEKKAFKTLIDFFKSNQ